VGCAWVLDTQIVRQIPFWSTKTGLTNYFAILWGWGRKTVRLGLYVRNFGILVYEHRGLQVLLFDDAFQLGR